MPDSRSLPPVSSPRLAGLFPLPHLGVIRVQGADAASFLHGQLTQDFALLHQQQARLAALLNPKGRMLASFIGFKRSADEVLLLCSRDLLAATLKRLSMFVLRAKARLSDASDQFQYWGLAGPAAQALLPAQAVPWNLACSGQASVVALYPADGQPRALWLAPLGEPLPCEPAPELQDAQHARQQAQQWQWGEVRSGVATLSAPLIGALVPQMLNYESIGGVNFKKGCYPGQEVVARSQFRGTLKRRGYLAHAAAALAPGCEVFAQGDAEQPVGLVVQCAAHPAGGHDLLLSLQVSAAEGALLADGQALTLLPLPYPLLEDI